MKKVVVLCFLIAFALPVAAETDVNPFVSFSTLFTGGLGMKEPGLGIGGGLEVSSPTVWFNIGTDYSPTDKKVYGNTNKISFKTRVLGRLPKGFLAGAGFQFSRLDFVDLKTRKEAIWPSLIVGWENGALRLTLMRFFTGKDDANHTRGYSFYLEGYLTSKARLLVRMSSTNYDRMSYYPEMGRAKGHSVSVSLVFLPFR